MDQLLRDKKTIFLLLSPGMLLFIFVFFVPIGMSMFYSVTDWKGIGDYHFIGLDNYSELLFNDDVFWRSLVNALLLTACTLLIQHPIAIFLAILLTKAGKWEKPLRTIFFIPIVISIVVTSQLWISVLSPVYGLLNKVLDTLGLGHLQQDWLGDPNIAIWSVIVIIMWQGFGYALLLYYAGLQGIAEELYEAAKLDGASSFTLYTSIVIPLLAPVMKVAVVLAVITCLKQMETVFLTTNGGPGDSTMFLGNYLYLKAFTTSLYGYGNAISVLFVAFCLLLTVIINKSISKWEVD